MRQFMTSINIKTLAERVIRKGTHGVAVVLHKLSRGRILPNDVTIAMLLLYLPLAFLIGTDHLIWAACLLISLSLLDTLDGGLARLQNKVTDVGGLLDAVSVRVKELFIYAGVLYLFSVNAQPPYVLLATIIACGASLITPFINAKGEAIIATYGHQLSYDRLSHMFTNGLLPYVARIALVMIGLLLGMTVLPWVMIVIAVLATLTMLQSLISITRGMR